MMGGARGFTLIETIMVMVVTGIIAGGVAIFIANPVQAYLASVRRAELSDSADTAVRRLGRDLRLALPNSLRLTQDANLVYLEFIMSSGGGRYRTDDDGSSGGHLPPGAVFDVLGPMPVMNSGTSGDYIVANNFGNGAYDDAYLGDNRRQISSVAGNTVTLADNPFRHVGAGISRFQVVPYATQAVSFVCPMATPGDFQRYWRYGFYPTQAAAIPNLAAGSRALLAANTTCGITYAANVQQRLGLLSITLNLSDGSGESVSLFYQVHVDNTP